MTDPLRHFIEASKHAPAPRAWQVPCTIPDSSSGPWSIESFKVTRDQVLLDNLRAIRNGNPEQIVHPGEFKRLCHDRRGLVMSNTHMEYLTARHAISRARGRVLVSGLGLGLVVNEFLHKSEVEFVKVIEIDADIIKLVGPAFTNNPRVQIVCADAFAYKPNPSDHFDMGWHDIWDAIDSENLPEMAKLKRKWCRRIDTQFCWSQTEALRERRRYG